MNIIVPAILTDSLTDFTEKLAMLESFPKVTRVHIDFADHRFVSNGTILPAVLPSLPIQYEFTAHLMVYDPESYLLDLQRVGFEIASFHYETAAGLSEVEYLSKKIRALGLKPQLAINPETPVEVVIPLLREIDRLHIMAVDPGFQGSPYHHEEEKITFLRKHGFYGTIVVDGGIDKNKVRALLAAGADQLVVGSAIMRARNPRKVYLDLLEEAGEGVQ